MAKMTRERMVKERRALAGEERGEEAGGGGRAG